MSSSNDRTRSNGDALPERTGYHLCIGSDGALIEVPTETANDRAALEALIDLAQKHARITGVLPTDDAIVAHVLEAERAALPTRVARRRFDRERDKRSAAIKERLSVRRARDVMLKQAQQQARADGVTMSVGYLIEFMLEQTRGELPTLAERIRFDRQRGANATAMRMTLGAPGAPAAPLENGTDVDDPGERPWPRCSLPDISNEELISMAREQAIREGVTADDRYVFEFTLEMLRSSITSLTARLDFDRYRAGSRNAERQQ
jgi:hypothetical protein